MRAELQRHGAASGASLHWRIAPIPRPPPPGTCRTFRRLSVRKPYIVKDISQIGVKVNEYKYRS